MDKEQIINNISRFFDTSNDMNEISDKTNEMLEFYVEIYKKRLERRLKLERDLNNKFKRFLVKRLLKRFHKFENENLKNRYFQFLEFQCYMKLYVETLDLLYLQEANKIIQNIK